MEENNLVQIEIEKDVLQHFINGVNQIIDTNHKLFETLSASSSFFSVHSQNLNAQEHKNQEMLNLLNRLVSLIGMLPQTIEHSTIKESLECCVTSMENTVRSNANEKQQLGNVLKYLAPIGTSYITIEKGTMVLKTILQKFEECIPQE